MGTPRSERTVCAALNSIPHNSSFFTLLLASVCEVCLQNKFKKKKNLAQSEYVGVQNG